MFKVCFFARKLGVLFLSELDYNALRTVKTSKRMEYKMNLAKIKMLLLVVLVVSVTVVVIHGGCQKQPGPQHNVAMTSDDLADNPQAAEKPIMKKVQGPENAPAEAEVASSETDAPEPVAEPVAVDHPAPAKPTSKDHAPLTEINRPATVVKLYRLKADDTYWKIAVRQLGNGQRWREIESLNPGVDPRTLKIGQTIRIPVE